ncbi:glyoxalase/bleomycin resistance/extradiol dioxygenase family protein [Kordia algicida OT-1]|uniref:Bleomycin resistance protein n=1 Tax=Kordia algicida OT-1 TaxID=391587 RepID=A9EDK2_9FLAO|nr:glyoxalase/bleomycin resistance/extradiol dioxygenase family protein [Kordia algicida]EDP94243.1 bleomycin resistance protein [Kordia algicida OT-1]
MKASDQFLSVHPVLAVKDVIASIGFYVHSLGFTLAFADDKTAPKYAGIRRGNVEIHLQWHDASEWKHNIDRPMLRFLVLNTEALFDEYKTKEVFHKQTQLRETAWGTKEFAFYDLDSNGLTFYEDL